MILQDVVKSKLDKTQKFLFTNNNHQVVEVSYIDHFNDKDSLCIPTQSGCQMACKFCHTTEALGKMKTTNLWSNDIIPAVRQAYDSLGLAERPRTLLLSFMGCGEPLANDFEVLQAIRGLTAIYSGKVPWLRFGMATSLPKGYSVNFIKMGETVRKEGMNLKVHLSLHFTDDAVRRMWMPHAELIKPSLDLLEWYQDYTAGPAEVHYTLIEGVNDTKEDAVRLGGLLEGRDIAVKFLRFNPKPNQRYLPTSPERVVEFCEEVSALNGQPAVTMECYTPPGADIGASCGQFLMDYYIKYANGVSTN